MLITPQWGFGPWGGIPWTGVSPAPPGELELFAIVPTRVAFGASSLGLQLSLIYQLPSSVAFGEAAIVQRSFITVFINGVDVIAAGCNLLVNTLQVTDALSQPTTASFSLWVPKQNLVPQVGQQVTIYVGNLRIFGGYIDQPFQTAFQATPGYGFLGTPSGSGGGSGGVGSATGGGSSSGGGAIACTDYSSLFSRRYVGLYFDGNGTPSPSFLNDIVAYIVETYLAADGFTYDDSDGDPGINLGPQLFNWVTVQSAFNTLSSSTGWDWKVDQFQVLRFFPSASGTGTAAFNIDEGDGNVYAESLGVEYYRSKYRNRQGVASPSQQGQLWEDIFSVADPGPFPNDPQPPDGVRKTFLQLYGFTATPIVTVDGNPQVVAQLTPSGFVPTSGWQWYIVAPSPGLPSYGLFQYGPDAPLGPSDTLIIEYATPISPILWLENATQIADRAAIEGNTGVYEDVEQAPSVTDPAAIMAYCSGLLARYSQGIPFQVSYSTRNQAGLFTGQLQNIETTNPPLSFVGLISNVVWQDVDGQFVNLSVTVLSGEYQGDFTQFFAALVAGTQLAQPANTSNYDWYFDGPVTTTTIEPQTFIVRNAVEAVLQLAVTVGQPCAGSCEISVLQNGNIIISVEYNPNQGGTLQNYATPGDVKMFAGDELQVRIFFSVLFTEVAQVSVQLNNVVLNT
jgi:hypothetical protein